MNFLKKAISSFLAITIVLSGSMAAFAKNPNKNSKYRKDNNYKKAAVITVGATAIALPSAYFLYKYLTRPQGPSREDVAKNLERRFIEKLNSYPAEKSPEVQKYIKLSPMMVGLGMLNSTIKRLNMNFIQTLKKDVYISLGEAVALKTHLLENLATLYGMISDYDKTKFPLSSSALSFENIYKDLATNHSWEKDTVADIYMELYNFYRYLSNAIPNLESPIKSANEVELQGNIVDSRDVNSTIERVCLY